MTIKRPAPTLCALVFAFGQTAADAHEPAGRLQLFSASLPAPISSSRQPAEVLLHSLPGTLQWLTLSPASDGSQAGLAAVQTPDGILLIGQSSDAGTWTLRWSTLMSLDLPEIGWQRAARPLRSDADCALLGLSAEDTAYCPEWRRDQLAHRARIRQAFMPGYRIRDAQGEPLATPAWRESIGFSVSVPASFSELDAGPAGPMRAWREDGGHFFALAIPWSAWPLTTHQVQRSLYLHAEYCPEHGRCLHASADPDTALEWALPEPLDLQPGACDETVRDDESNPSFLRIADSLRGHDRSLTHTYTFDNPGGGYLDRPDPDRLSPELWATEHRREALDADGAWSLCVPSWRLTNGAGLSIAGTRLNQQQLSAIERDADPAGWSGTRHPFWEAESPRFDEARGGYAAFEQRRLDERRLLLLTPYRIDPPRSGEGMNGACDRTHFSVWVVDRVEPSLRMALNLGGYAPDMCAGSALVSAELSADGRYVDSLRRTYDYEAPEASDGLIDIHERYCLDEVSNTYLLCRREAVPAAE